MHPVLMRWRWAAGILLLFIAGAEAGLRWGIGLGDPPLVYNDPNVEYRLVPSADYRRFGNLISVNSHGMRGIEHSAVPTANVRRVMLIGDSVVYGNHRLDQSETLAAQMTKRLSDDHHLSECLLHVMPAAASSWGPHNQSAFLADTGLLGADVGVILVSAHDLYDVPTFDNVIPYRIQSPWGALDDARQVLQERLARRLAEPIHSLSAEERQSITLKALDRLKDQFATANVPLVLVYHPTVSERGQAPRHEFRVFRDWAEGQSRPFFNLGSVDLDQSAYRDDIHPNPHGSTMIAQHLATWTLPYLQPC